MKYMTASSDMPGYLEFRRTISATMPVQCQTVALGTLVAFEHPMSDAEVWHWLEQNNLALPYDDFLLESTKEKPMKKFETLEDLRELKWHRRFVEVAALVSSWSKDRSTKVGAVVVVDRRIVATGFNGFPMGCDDNVEARHARPEKYLWFEHAERNCVYQAARIGLSLNGATLYLNYAPMPCADCSRAVIQAGIKRIVTGPEFFPGLKEKWAEHFRVSTEMLREAGVEVINLPEELTAGPTSTAESKL